MKFIKLSKTVFLALMITSGLISCGNAENNKDAKEVAEDHNDAKFDKVAESDAQNVVDAYAAGLYEIRMADTATVYATTKEAKELAAMLADAHRGFNSQLSGLAAKKQITLPTEIAADQLDNINSMRDQKRIEFDKDYASLMVSKHKDAINMYEKCSTDCTDADIKSWFAGALPELRQHLDMAMTSEAKIKEMKN